MSKDAKTLVLIDSNAIIHRAYHALPKNMSTSTGEMTNAVYGYTTTLIKILEDLHPDYIAASFDLAGPTFRHDEYKEYKATRVKADQELYDQIPLVRELLETLEIPVFEKEGFEADDVIGTLAELCRELRVQRIEVKDAKPSTLNSKLDIYIVTGDKDAFQLIDGNIFVYNLRHGLSNAQIVDRAVIEKEWNLQPEDFIDLKALAGDPSDNIPGVPGIGNKTATTLLQTFDTLAKLYERIESILPVIPTEAEESDAERHPELVEGSILSQDLSTGVAARDDKEYERVAKELNLKPRIVRLLIENKDQAFLSQRLATIRRDVPLDFKLEDCKWGDYDRSKLADFFKRMQFRSLLRRFGATDDRPPAKTEIAKEDSQLRLL